MAPPNPEELPSAQQRPVPSQAPRIPWEHLAPLAQPLPEPVLPPPPPAQPAAAAPLSLTTEQLQQLLASVSQVLIYIHSIDDALCYSRLEQPYIYLSCTGYHCPSKAS